MKMELYIKKIYTLFGGNFRAQTHERREERTQTEYIIHIFTLLKLIFCYF